MNAMVGATHSPTGATHGQRRGSCVSALDSPKLKKFIMADFKTNELDMIAEAIAERLAVYHKEFLTTREAASYLNMSVSYLYKLTMDREIPHSKPLGKVCYFERADLDNWLRKNRVATKEEIQQQANDYCARKGGKR